MSSKYIVIEGLEGAGKTTARNLVVETLKSLGVTDMTFTREPGGTVLAEKLRSLVLDIKSVGDEVITITRKCCCSTPPAYSWWKRSLSLRWRVANGLSATVTIFQRKLIRAAGAVSIASCWRRCVMPCSAISRRT